MAIGTTAAILGGASILGGVMSSKAQKKAAKRAAQTSQDTAQLNDATLREFYGRNEAVLSPFQERGNQAGEAIASLSGLNGQPAYDNAFGNYRKSTGYDFRVGEGVRALSAGAPVRNSGATAKALTQYGQNIGSQEYGNYINQLQGQQNIGFGAASAQAGVGQNAANSLVANNNTNSTNQANAALLRGNATAGMWNGIGGGLGTILGSSFGR
jgi:hypothetical protein